jgi:hypothetical protein
MFGKARAKSPHQFSNHFTCASSQRQTEALSPAETEHRRFGLCLGKSSCSTFVGLIGTGNRTAKSRSHEPHAGWLFAELCCVHFA